MTGLWWTCPDACRVSAAWLQLLHAGELQRHARYRSLAKRHEFLVARVMVRTLLGQWLGVAPAALCFQTNQWDRPELAPPHSLRFSLTHTDGLIALLVSDQFEVGLDAEPLARGASVLALNSGVFAAQELTDIAALPLAQQGERAVTLWTLKESYAKARGMGFALAFDELVFRLGGLADSQVVLEEKSPDMRSGADWHFETFHHGPHVISACLAALSGVAADLSAESRPSLAPLRGSVVRWEPGDFGL